MVLKNDMKNKVADLMLDFFNKTYSKENIKGMHHQSSVVATAEIIKQVPVLILVFKEKDNDWLIGDILSIGACIQNIILRATDLGIGSLWIRDTDDVAEQISDMVGYKELELNSAIAIGYANNIPKARQRKKLKDVIIHYE